MLLKGKAILFRLSLRRQQSGIERSGAGSGATRDVRPGNIPAVEVVCRVNK